VTIRALLADDHRVVREGIQALLEREPDIEVVGTCGDGRSAIQLASNLRPDVVVIDVGMPDLNGIDATRQILAAVPTARIVVLSVYSDKRYVLGALRAGASGYVLKVGAHDDLLRAVRAVAAGKHYLSPEITGVVIDEQSSVQQSSEPVLGAREREVLQLLAEGKTSPQIAQHLHVSVKTVETHRRNIMDKLGMHNVAELTKYAIREGISTLE
jgi:DNA-binding NarL/FixJ family response regulator